MGQETGAGGSAPARSVASAGAGGAGLRRACQDMSPSRAELWLRFFLERGQHGSVSLPFRLHFLFPGSVRPVVTSPEGNLGVRASPWPFPRRSGLTLPPPCTPRIYTAPERSRAREALEAAGTRAPSFPKHPRTPWRLRQAGVLQGRGAARGRRDKGTDSSRVTLSGSCSAQKRESVPMGFTEASGGAFCPPLNGRSLFTPVPGAPGGVLIGTHSFSASALAPVLMVAGSPAKPQQLRHWSPSAPFTVQPGVLAAQRDRPRAGGWEFRVQQDQVHSAEEPSRPLRRQALPST